MGEFVKIIHPETGGVAEVDEVGLQQYYAAGWRLLRGEDPLAQEEPEPPPPEPVTEAEVSAARSAKAGSGKPKSSSKPESTEE